MLSISSMSKYLDEEIYSETLLFSGVALLNWFIKSSISKEVLTIMSYYDHFLGLSSARCCC